METKCPRVSSDKCPLCGLAAPDPCPLDEAPPIHRPTDRGDQGGWRLLRRRVLSVIVPFVLDGVERRCRRSGRRQDAERNDPAGQKSMAAGVGWKVSATA